MTDFRTTSGTLSTTGQFIDLNVAGCSTALLQITGTWTGTVSWTVSTVGNAFIGSTGIIPSNTSVSYTEASSITSNNSIYLPVGGAGVLRITGTTISSGTAIIDVSAGPGTSPIKALASIIRGASNSNGSSNHHLVSAATTNATSVKASAGQVYVLTLVNTTVTNKFVKLFNKASAPTVGTDTPVMTVSIPANNTYNYESAAMGINMQTGIAYAITGAAGDLDVTAVAAGDVIVSMYYV